MSYQHILPSSAPYYGNRLIGSESAYVLARMRFLLGLAPEPTMDGWGATNPARRNILDDIAQNLINKAQE